jgi:hypothetical protein
MVVGYDNSGALAWVLQNSIWKPVTVTGGSGEYPKSVSCPTTSSCWAVGGNGTTTFAAHWTGTAFATVASPSVGTDDYLNGVSCVQTTCIAVGGGSMGGLFERSTGAAFKTVKGGTTATGYVADLWSVSCVSTTACMAVGEQDGPTAYKTLTELYNGSSFTTKSSPSPIQTASFPYNTLLGVNCLSISDCWAAGQGGAYAFGGPNPTSKDRATIALYWNGTSWARAASANPGNYPSGFLAVSCATTTVCQAVGAQTTQSTALAEQLAS